MALFELATPRDDGTHDIDPQRVAEAGDRVRIVDVREPEEFVGELGHVPGSELVPLGAFPDAAQAWPRDRELVLVCRSGRRSGRIALLLVELGFSRVMNMVGGMMAWGAAGLPIER